MRRQLWTFFIVTALGVAYGTAKLFVYPSKLPAWVHNIYFATAAVLLLLWAVFLWRERRARSARHP